MGKKEGGRDRSVFLKNLDAYILYCLSQGRSKFDIERELLGYGWSREYIEDSFNFVKQKKEKEIPKKKIKFFDFLKNFLKIFKFKKKKEKIELKREKIEKRPISKKEEVIKEEIPVRFEIKRKDPILVVVLTIVTFGIYGLIWIYSTIKQFVKITNSKTKPIIMFIGFFIPLVNIYMFWKLSKLIEEGTNKKLQKVLIFVLFLFLIPVAIYLVQKELNKFAAIKKKGEIKEEKISIEKKEKISKELTFKKWIEEKKNKKTIIYALGTIIIFIGLIIFIIIKKNIKIGIWFWLFLVIIILTTALGIINVIFLKKEKEKKKREKIEKKKKIKPRPIIYAKKEYKTDIDTLYELIQQKKKISMLEVMKKFLIDKKKAEHWAKILEENNLIEIHYPAFGEPILELKKKGEEK